MTEWAVLAAGLVSAVTPYLVKGAEKVVEKAAEEGWTERGQIWEKVKGLFAADNRIISIFEEDPEAKENQDFLAAKLAPKLEAVPETAKELDEMLKTLPRPQVNKTNIINQTGDGHIAMQDISGSQINIGGKPPQR